MCLYNNVLLFWHVEQSFMMDSTQTYFCYIVNLFFPNAILKNFARAYNH